MKPFEEIRSNRAFQTKERWTVGGNGWATIRGKTFFVVYTTNAGWDHVSVSTHSRCPTWEEMCAIKDMFFDAEEFCVEYHPKKSEYINNMPYCLHIWKPQNKEMPRPPKELVL